MVRSTEMRLEGGQIAVLGNSALGTQMSLSVF